MSNLFTNPEAAARYNLARQMPQQSIDLWLNRLKAAIPVFSFNFNFILDLGCGTGRFTLALANTFDCPVIGVEPSEAMLNVAKQYPYEDVDWRLGSAENIPVEDGSIDLVFMSQVFHHLLDPAKAIQEIWRVLTSGGFLAIRNSTLENNVRVEWLKFFPEALEIEEKRILSRKDLEGLVNQYQFRLMTRETIEQYFSASYEEYFKKIGGRGLSSLLAISDTAFESGLTRFKEWVSLQPADVPVYEPIDLFVFRKESA